MATEALPTGLKMESYGYALIDASKALELDRTYIKGEGEKKRDGEREGGGREGVDRANFAKFSSEFVLFFESCM